MVKKMNKTGFINELEKQTNYPKEKCMIINNILEEKFFISKKSKDKIINAIHNKLEVSNEEANRIYEIATRIVKEEIKNKLKHPFKNLDS